MDKLTTAQGHWDAVLMDLHMPGMNGLDTARAIRASALPGRGVPIVALTAHSTADMMEAARAAGMNEFLTKPVDASQLYETLRKLRSREAPEHPAAGVPAGAAAPDAQSHAQAGPLLDRERLERYREIGMLEELVADDVPEIERLIARLQEAGAQQDLEACLELLHSLVGLGGEAGARALHLHARQVYVAMLQERKLPTNADWTGQLAQLAEKSGRALGEYGHAGQDAG
jgi:CheY-like chemotaxis protein